LIEAEEDPACQDLAEALAKALAALPEGGHLTIVEFAAEGIVVWKVRRDQAGTPLGCFWPTVTWPSLQHGGVITDGQLRGATQVEPGSAAIGVCGSPESPPTIGAFNQFRHIFPEVLAIICAAPVDNLLRAAISHDPLTQWYELVTLNRTASGRLVLHSWQLFPPTSTRGERRSFTIRCEPSDSRGTAFVVLATLPVRRFQLVSLESAKIPVGRYRVTAELLRPGRVRFDGLPVPLRKDRRSWPELISAVPARLDAPRAATHLICAVETSGGNDQVNERFDRVEQLVRNVAEAAGGQLALSLLAYGPHSFQWNVPDTPITEYAWMLDEDEMLSALGRLRDRGPTRTGYPHAAQIECMLAEVARRLGARPDQPTTRPVLVTVGDRRNFPHQIDVNSNILPCPHRSNWRSTVRQLLDEHPDMAFGAIRDRQDGEGEEIWDQLGRHASAFAHAGVNVPRFAADLGLLSADVQTIPLPLIETV
jgi:hypothetical protein